MSWFCGNICSLCNDFVPDIKHRGYITVATNAEFEPFEYKDGDKMVGIDRKSVV